MVDYIYFSIILQDILPITLINTMKALYPFKNMLLFFNLI